MMPIAFDNSYARLPERFFARVAPTAVRAPGVVRVNEGVAGRLGIPVDVLGAGVLAGNALLAGSEPIAQGYAGHQFGHFSPQLGDGRAILLGEVIGGDGARYDVQLKGAGRTPFSRGGDGRAGVGPVLREYVVSEAMAALGVPTTRALGAVTTGETIRRDGFVPGAVLARVASSHLRVGTFQWLAGLGDEAGVRVLADYAIARHYPGLEGDYAGFLRGVIERQAGLVARWMLLGFVHGVMNTDNMTISGETIDYGPCAFMEAYDPATVFSSIDEAGRYAYGRQPRVAAWNLARLAEALLPLLGETREAAIAVAEGALEGFGGAFEAGYLGGLREKLGMVGVEEGDEGLMQELLAVMRGAGADWTLAFRGVAELAAGDEAGVRGVFGGESGFWAWVAKWRGRVAGGEGLLGVNPVYVPRNHLVEEALRGAEAGDYAGFEALLEVIGRPFERRVGLERYALAARPEERVLATFCGT